MSGQDGCCEPGKPPGLGQNHAFAGTFLHETSLAVCVRGDTFHRGRRRCGGGGRAAIFLTKKRARNRSDLGDCGASLSMPVVWKMSEAKEEGHGDGGGGGDGVKVMVGDGAKVMMRTLAG